MHKYKNNRSQGLLQIIPFLPMGRIAVWQAIFTSLPEYFCHPICSLLISIVINHLYFLEKCSKFTQPRTEIPFLFPVLCIYEYNVHCILTAVTKAEVPASTQLDKSLHSGGCGPRSYAATIAEDLFPCSLIGPLGLLSGGLLASDWLTATIVFSPHY